MAGDIEGRDQPEGLNATEMMILHDPEAQTATAIVFFDNEEDYAAGHAVLDAMPTGRHAGQPDIGDEDERRREDDA